MCLIFTLFSAIAYVLTVVLFAKLSWDYFLVYLYAYYVVNRSDDQLRDSLGYFPGAWALVTGATDGIGQSYARHLARLGFNIILLGRSTEKLAATRQELESDRAALECRARLKLTNEKDWIREALLDLSVQIDGPTVEKVLEPIIRGLDLRVLVNNAGVSFDKPTLFMDLGGAGGEDGYAICKRLVDVNITSLLNVTRACMGHMSLKPPQPKQESQSKPLQGSGGIIINLSSFSALGAVPLIGVYAATKAFVWHFGRCLGAEYEARGLTVQTVTPYFVVTKMTKLKRASLFRPNPDVYVKWSLKMVHVQDVTFGYMPHAFMGILFSVANYFMPTITARMTYKASLAISKKRAEKLE